MFQISKIIILKELISSIRSFKLIIEVFPFILINKNSHIRALKINNHDYLLNIFAYLSLFVRSHNPTIRSYPLKSERFKVESDPNNFENTKLNRNMEFE